MRDDKLPDRVPPHNLDAERSVVGALLLDPDRIPDVAEMLRPDDFFDPRHRIVFDALVRLSEQSVPVDFLSVGEALQALVDADHPVSCRWISEAELDANPDLVRTMSVQPPRGKGDIRLLEIEGVDLQPCGGTHLRSTAEVGKVRIGKVEKKGRRNRRVNIHLDD